MKKALVAALACLALSGCHSEESKYYAGGESSGAKDYYTFDVDSNKAVMHSHLHGMSQIYPKTREGYCRVISSTVKEKTCLSFANENDVIMWDEIASTDPQYKHEFGVVNFNDPMETVHYLKAN